MFISLADVKSNNTYDYVRNAAPTVNDDSASGFAVGETWLNLTTGYSYEASDVSVGAAVWDQIELSEDNLITANADNTVLRFIEILNNKFIIDRNDPWEDLSQSFPSSSKFGRKEAFKLEQTESLYSKFTFDNATSTIGVGDDLYGDLTQFAANDYILIEGTRRNDGYFTIASTTVSTIVVNETLVDGEAYGFIYLSEFPDDFLSIMGRVIWWDVYKSSEASNGLKSEKIGTYSYTLADVANSSGYPDDIIRGLQAYEGISMGGGSIYVN